MSAIVSTSRLYRRFGGVVATNEVSVEFEDKRLTSIIGPNGAGKTTLINLITGLIPCSGGRVMFRDKDITNRPPHVLTRLGVCRTFQITSIFHGLSAFENVRIACQAKLGGSYRILSRKKNLKEVNEKTWSIMEKLDLKEKASTSSGNLAHGDQRLLEVAMAMAGEPKILFLDEPTAGMSPAETRHIERLIKALSESIPVVLVEHDMDVVMEISDHITVLHHGQVIAEGTPAAIRENDLVKEAYLGHE